MDMPKVTITDVSAECQLILKEKVIYLCQCPILMCCGLAKCSKMV